MKRYKFKMEPLLVKRQTLEEQGQQELAEANRILKEHQDALNSLYGEYRTHHLKADRGNLSPGDLRLFTNYAQILLDRIEEERKAVRDQRKVVDAVKEKLRELHKETRIVEILKEKDQTRFKNEVRRMENKQIDDHTILRHAGDTNRKRDKN